MWHPDACHMLYNTFFIRSYISCAYYNYIYVLINYQVKPDWLLELVVWSSCQGNFFHFPQGSSWLNTFVSLSRVLHDVSARLCVSGHQRVWWGGTRSCLSVSGLVCLHDVFVFCLRCLGSCWYRFWHFDKKFIGWIRDWLHISVFLMSWETCWKPYIYT